MRLSPLVAEGPPSLKAATPQSAPRTAGGERFHFHGYQLDRSTWVVRWQDTPIVLSPKSFDLLLYLVDHCDRVVCKDELLKALWPRQIVEESNLSQHVFLLRKALSRHAGGAKLIETVVGRGYRFVAVLETAPGTQVPATVVEPGALAADAAPPPRSIRFPRTVAAFGHLSNRLTLAAAMFALGVSAGHFWQIRGSNESFALSLPRSDQTSPVLVSLSR